MNQSHTVHCIPVQVMQATYGLDYDMHGGSSLNYISPPVHAIRDAGQSIYSI